MPSSAQTRTPLHTVVERVVGADARPLYGIVVPLFATIGLIIALAVSGDSWMAVPAFAFLVLSLVVVVVGLFGMLNDDDESSSH